MDTDPTPSLPDALKQHLAPYKAPPGLERRVREMLARETRRPGLLARAWDSAARWMPVAAGFACGIVVSAGVAMYHDTALQDDALEQQVVDSHVRSLMASHLTDVVSSDRHTVKPWFNGKLDFAPPVIDLAPQGFPLAGGRLDYLQDRPVGALVYQRRGHTINVFVMPAGDVRASRLPPSQARHGYQIAQWQSGGMQFWAVSDLGRDEMAAFTAAMKAAAGS